MQLDTLSPNEFLDTIAEVGDCTPEQFIGDLSDFYRRNKALFPAVANGEKNSSPIARERIHDYFRFLIVVLQETLVRFDVTGLEEDTEYSGESYIALLREMTLGQVREVLSGIPKIKKNLDDIPDEQVEGIRELVIVCAYFFLECDDGFDGDEGDEDDEPIWDPSTPMFERELVGV